MKIICYPSSLVNHIMEGFKKHNVSYQIDQLKPPYEPCDLAVTWGLKKDVMEVQEKHNGRTLIMELGYIGDRRKNYSIGYDGLNGRADFCNKKSPSDRWVKHQHLKKPWMRNDKGHVLVLGQMPFDQSLVYPGIDMFKELRNVFMQAANDGFPYRYRPHPQYKRFKKYKQDLYKDLQTARCAVTINSNSAVDAVLYGIPTITLDEGSMAYPVTQHYLQFEKLEYPDRLQWCYDLGFAQWEVNEIKNGEAWDHLKQGIE